jgi:hypothetical protein
MNVNAATLQPIDRERDDFYATPRSAVEQLLDVEKFDGNIWEPACGDGAISRVLQERGYHTINSDLIDRGFGLPRQDFLTFRVSQAPNIVTNPPFKLGTEFVRHALNLDPVKVAMLLKIGFLEGPTKADLHDQLARIWVIRRRVTFLKNGQEFSRSNGKGGIHTYAWFVWEAGFNGKPTIGWLEGEPCK